MSAPLASRYRAMMSSIIGRTSFICTSCSPGALVPGSVVIVRAIFTPFFRYFLQQVSINNVLSVTCYHWKCQKSNNICDISESFSGISIKSTMRYQKVAVFEIVRACHGLSDISTLYWYSDHCEKRSPLWPHLHLHGSKVPEKSATWNRMC